MRLRHSENHFEVLKQTDGQTTTSSHFLKFDQSLRCPKQAACLTCIRPRLFAECPALRFQEPVDQATQNYTCDTWTSGSFFPAEKEASGLRFHLHAPFVPELSHASIKQTPANQPLFQQLATLAATALHQIRDLELLTVEFLSVLPNPQDQLPPRYNGIRDAIVKEMNTKPLTPTYSKSHAPAKHLLSAKASLKDLLTEGDVDLLVAYDDVPLRWAATATQKNSNADRFLTGLAITEWDVNEFVALISQKASEGKFYISSAPYVLSGPDSQFMGWLAAKPGDWHQKLYSLLYAELSPVGGCKRLKGLKIVRLSDGTYSVGSKCFFPGDGIEHDKDTSTRRCSRLFFRQKQESTGERQKVP